MTNTIEKDMFLFVLAYQNHINISFSMVLVIKENSCEGGAGGLNAVLYL